MRNLAKIQLRPLLFLFIASALINIFLWLYANREYQSATDFVPLHYTIYYGIDLIDAKIKLFTYPLFGIIILAANAWISRLFMKERLIGYLLAGATFLIESFITIAFTALVVNYH